MNHSTCHLRRSATFLSTAVAVGLAAMAGTAVAQAPPEIDSISPDSVLEKPVPQPEIVIEGSGFLVGFPSPSNLPTIKLAHQGSEFQFSLLPDNINFSGTRLTILPGQNHFNLLQAPVGSYDLTVTRPDGQSATVSGAFSINVPAEPEPGAIEMRVASYWGGPIMGMDLSPDGDLAYLANGRVLRILDMSDESNPTSIGSIFLEGVYDVKVRDGYAFVAAQQPYGFCVVDVSDPTTPQLMWAAGGTRRQVELYGNYAYAHSSNIHVYDISDPLNVVSNGGFGGSSINAFTIKDDRLVTNHGVYNLATNPKNPPLIGSFSGVIGENGGSVSSIAVSGDYAYMAGGNSLRTFDISDPSHASIVDVKPDFYRAVGVAVADGQLFVADSINGPGNEPSSAKGLVVYDIAADPSAPALITAYKPNPNNNPRGVRAMIGRVYSFDDAEGLVILDMAVPTTPHRLGKYHSPSHLKKILKTDDHIIVADWYGGFTILDVSDQNGAFVIGTYQADSWADLGPSIQDMAIQDDVVYISLQRRGLDAVDISDPANPTLISNFFPPLPNWGTRSTFSALDVKDDVAHISFEDSVHASLILHRYLTVDISDLENMTEIGRSPHYADAFRMKFLNVHGDVAYGSGDAYSFARVYDVSDIENPIQSPTASVLSGAGRDIAIHNGSIFGVWADLGNGNPYEGMHVYDNEADPEHPDVVLYADWGKAQAVHVQNDRAYVVGLGNPTGLKLLDVNDPAAPVEIDSLAGSIGAAHGVSYSNILVDEPRAYVTSMPGNSQAKAGLVIVDVHGVEPQGPLGDLNNDRVVDVSDLLILLSAWGGCPRSADCQADLNSDGVVDVSDLLALLGNWG